MSQKNSDSQGDGWNRNLGQKKLGVIDGKGLRVRHTVGVRALLSEECDRKRVYEESALVIE